MLHHAPKLAKRLNNTKLSVTLIRSTIGRPAYQREIVKVLGLNKINKTRIHDDSPAIWGMCTKTIHLIRLERIHADDPRALAALSERKSKADVSAGSTKEELR